MTSANLPVVRHRSVVAARPSPASTAPRKRLTSGDATRIGLFVAAIGVPLAGIITSAAGG